MTTPVSSDTEKFGPGVLKIGATGSAIEASCLVNSLKISGSPDRGDSKTMLCGTVKAGSVRYDYEMSGNLDLDLNAGADGLFALSQAAPGSTQPFEFTPNEIGGTTATGSLILDPMDFGGDEYGEIMNSDVTWTLVGQPTYDYGTGTPATGATAGTPGTWTPGGSTPPANAAGATSSGVTASPTTAWTTGQYVQGSTAGTGGEMYWNGTAWTAGKAA